MKLSHLTTLLAAALALAACGGDGSPPPDPKFFSGPDDSVATRISAASSLEEAATFEAATTAIQRDFDAETTTQLPREPTTVRLFRTSPDTLSLVIKTASGEFSFGPEDLDDWGEFWKEDYISLAGQTGQRSWLRNANGYGINDNGAINPAIFRFHFPFTVQDYTAEDSLTEHWGMIGLETSPSDMPQSRTAHFRGWGEMKFYQSAQPREREKFDIDQVYLTADFANNSISGLLDKWVLVEGGSDSPTGISYQLMPTEIDGNGFSGSLAPSASCSDASCYAMPDSSVVGKFYGPYAAEVGAIIETGTVTDAEGVSWVGFGTFSAR